MQSESQEPYDANVLTDAGQNICRALGTLLAASVSSRLDSDPIDEEVSEEYVTETIEAHGFKPVGDGLGRSVYHLPSVYHTHTHPLVVKFSRPCVETVGDERNGTAQNRTETHISSLLEDSEYQKWFAPVTDADPDERYVVMVECNTDDADESHLEAVRNGLADAPWKPELDDGEVGLTPDGTPVAVDYGIVNTRW